jgi:prepilin-type N-terminal cleavage/methylation domain-containing protein
MRKGFSMVEILVAFAIIGVLAGLLLPVLGSSRKQALLTNDMSNLKQLATAALLYREQNERFPGGTIDLVRTKLVPAELCASHMDANPKGIGNDIGDFTGYHARLSPMNLVVAYKNSYAGAREYRLDPAEYEKWATPERAGGWLLNLTAAKRGPGRDYVSAKGTYQRLLFDGSVATRTFIDLTCLDVTNVGAPCRTDIALFMDPDTEYKNSLMKQ